MEEENERFLYFSLQKDGNIKFSEGKENSAEFVLPRHPETHDLDIYYLQSMLKYFDPTKSVLENEILDAFPVLSLTKDKSNKYYKLSVYRLREFYKDKIEEDEYIQASMKHLFMYSLVSTPTNETLKRVITGCLDKVTPVMYRRDERDTVECESYQLHCLASYVPTTTFRIMKLLKGWIEGALHFYDYSIMFFDHRFVGFDDFNENIIDLKAGNKSYFQVYAEDEFTLDELEMYYDMKLHVNQNIRERLFTPPNNDNERDGKVMMFRNDELRARLEEILTHLFRKGTFRLNNVFKWNRYPNGGKFNSHYDTMFVQNSTKECSLYTLLLYLEVKGDSFMYLYGEKEIQVPLKKSKAYIIPHWVKHRVEGDDEREFIKTEIVFKNKDIGTTYDATLADAFDASCYYMLQSIRHPELKDIVSRNFNTINEARFYKTVFVPKLLNKIFFIKSISKIPFEYYHSLNGNLIKTDNVKLNFITDGTYYYFKTKDNVDGNKPVVSFNDALIMLSVMQLDIQPKKMFTRSVSECQCSHRCVDYCNQYLDFEIGEEIVYWETEELESKIADTLQYTQYPSNVGKVGLIGNISVCDMPDDPKIFYFAACQNVSPCNEFNQSFITEVSSRKCNGNYSSLNVEFIGKQKNIVKIRQHSFKNGVIVSRRWITDRD